MPSRVHANAIVCWGASFSLPGHGRGYRPSLMRESFPLFLNLYFNGSSHVSGQVHDRIHVAGDFCNITARIMSKIRDGFEQFINTFVLTHLTNYFEHAHDSQPFPWLFHGLNGEAFRGYKSPLWNKDFSFRQRNRRSVRACHFAAGVFGS